MRSVVLGSVVTLILFTGLFVSQVEAKNNNNQQNGNYNQQNGNYQHDNHRRSVPIPGTLLALGGGLVGLVAWRARQRKPKA
jgi:hypothetical protein